MLDIDLVRKDSAAFDAAMLARGMEAMADRLLELDKKRREAIERAQAVQAQSNKASKAIGAAKAQGDEAKAQEHMESMGRLKEQRIQYEAEAETCDSALKDILGILPNFPLDDVPRGDESANEEIRKWGEPLRGNEHQPHYAMGGGAMDFEAAAAMSGARFVVLRGELARLERALGQFMLDMHIEAHGYQEIAPPFLVRHTALFGTGQLPKFAEDSFKTDDGTWLIPTGEVPLTNLVAGQILEPGVLAEPMRFTALTPCFRSEAGAAGRDTRGMIRLKQFMKTELVSITSPEQGEGELERMTQCAEAVLKALELPYRVMLLASGDMGFSACKTYDLEVWLPSQQTYREISSCSYCGDFQARRMQARYRPQAGAKPRFVHTLNGSALAVGRTLAAVMEVYAQSENVIAIPDVLRPYMRNQTHIEFNKGD